MKENFKMEKEAKKEVISNPRFYSDGSDFVFDKKVVNGKVIFDNTKKKGAKKASKTKSKDKKKSC